MDHACCSLPECRWNAEPTVFSSCRFSGSVAVCSIVIPLCWTICALPVANWLTNECGFWVDFWVWSCSSSDSQPQRKLAMNKLPHANASLSVGPEMRMHCPGCFRHCFSKIHRCHLTSCSHGVAAGSGDFCREPGQSPLFVLLLQVVIAPLETPGLPSPFLSFPSLGPGERAEFDPSQKRVAFQMRFCTGWITGLSRCILST